MRGVDNAFASAPLGCRVMRWKTLFHFASFFGGVARRRYAAMTVGGRFFQFDERGAGQDVRGVDGLLVLRPSGCQDQHLIRTQPVDGDDRAGAAFDRHLVQPVQDGKDPSGTNEPATRAES